MLWYIIEIFRLTTFKSKSSVYACYTSNLLPDPGTETISWGSRWQWRKISIRILHGLESWGIIVILIHQRLETREITIITTFPIHQGITIILLALQQLVFATAGDQARYIYNVIRSFFGWMCYKILELIWLSFHYSEFSWGEQNQCKQSKQSVTWW